MFNESNTYFKGFSIDAIDFLGNLKRNNNKIWFDENKDYYKEFILTPMQNLVMSLDEFILSIDPLVDVTPSINKTISRIYRDVRFSKDKSPYRYNMWVSFKRPLQDHQSRPEFFFEITPDSYSYGMGFYSAGPHTMELFRQRINDNPTEFKKAISFYSKQDVFTLEGEKYKRILDKSKSDEILNWYQRKNLYLINTKKIDNTLFSSKLVDELKSGFSLLSDFYHYLYKIQE